MEERSSAPMCDRGNDLIEFLYGELNEREALEFERHLQTCRQCKLELGGFRQVRESIIAWRQESLSLPTAPVAGNAVVPAIFGTLEPRKPSAMAAIREFFDLSPLWLKGAVAFASILFCIVAVLAVARLFDKSAPPVANNKRYTEEELSAKIVEAVQSKLRELEARKDQAAAGPTVADNNGQRTTAGRITNRTGGPAADSPTARRSPLTKSEREQLAADLRLISPKDETALDLLGDRINQQQ